MYRQVDVVEFTGTHRPVILENGYGAWNAGCVSAPPSRDEVTARVAVRLRDSVLGLASSIMDP